VLERLLKAIEREKARQQLERKEGDAPGLVEVEVAGDSDDNVEGSE
jgi:hypothetical protein